MDESLENQRTRHVERTERMLGIPVSGITHSGQTLGFRARIELTPGRDGQLGYRAPRSHTPVPVQHCPVARPEINENLVGFVNKKIRKTH